LNSVDGIVEVFRIAPRCMVSILENRSGPKIQSFVDLCSRALELDKVIMCEVEFGPRLKWFPRTRSLAIELRVQIWRAASR
jgi:hypothetical protein